MVRYPFIFQHQHGIHITHHSSSMTFTSLTVFMQQGNPITHHSSTMAFISPTIHEPWQSYHPPFINQGIHITNFSSFSFSRAFLSSKWQPMHLMRLSRLLSRPSRHLWTAAFHRHLWTRSFRKTVSTR